MPEQYNRILIVDDDIALLNSLKDVLSHYKFNVDIASSVNIALKNVNQTQYSLIISDIEMPKKSGLELLKQLKEVMLVTTPVILMTGHFEIDYAIEAISLGVDDFIKKPIESHIILKAINNILIKQSKKKIQDKTDPNIREINWILEFTAKDYLHQNIPEQIVNLIKTNIKMPLKTINELSVCLEETITNAFVHGTLCVPEKIRIKSHNEYRSFVDKQMKTEIAKQKVFVDICFKNNTIYVSVKDQGKGFDIKSYNLSGESLLNFTNATGRGLSLVNMLADKLSFEEDGTKVSIQKRIHEYS
ncbi:MAG: response regulator [Candidatus Cloacimonadales bacterium]|jgi:DNA-binding response OmpR family regulator|nr:response regulator [Candidatus Cloacimonadota bacterium]MDX9977753.1 response regulator [Candidatus Cloacimonadales bacterium]